MQSVRTQHLVRTLAIAVALLAPLSLVVMTLPTIVNVPFMDEWAWAPLAYHARTGTLTFAMLVAPHNEHRNVVPNLVFLAIDRIGGWNVPAESAFSLAVFVGADALLWLLVRRTIPGRRGLIAFALMSLVLCSFGQWENFVLGYNIGWNLCTLGIVAVVVLSSWPAATTGTLLAAAIVAVLASFSSGQGLLLWPCGIVALGLTHPNARRRLLAWAVAGAVVSAGYFVDYHPEPLAIPPGAPAASAASFFFAFLGGTIRPGSGALQSVICGVLVFAAASAAIAFALQPRANVLRVACAPWIALAAYGLLGAALTAAGRHRLGDDFAIQSHYEAISVFVVLAAIALVALSWPSITARVRSGWAVAAAALIALTAGVDAHGLRYIHQFATARTAEIAALSNDGPDLAVLALNDRTQLRRFVRELRSVGDAPFLHLRSRRSPAMRGLSR